MLTRLAPARPFRPCGFARAVVGKPRAGLGQRLSPCLSFLSFEIPTSTVFSYNELQQQEGPAPLPEPPSGGTLLDVMPYIGKLALGEKSLDWRVAAALLLLAISKAAGLACPWMLKRAVDEISLGVGMQGVVYAIVAYGICDVVKHAAKELQMPIFSPVSQAAARRIAYHTFAHVLDLDIHFHLDKSTGRLSQILERGKRSIQYLYRAIFFTFLPTFVELIVVCCVLGGNFSPWVAVSVGATFTVYTAWTISLTQRTADARKKVIALENQTSGKAVDALINYETVALFNNQRLEVGQYDWYLKGFQEAMLHIERLSAIMNAGQSAILATGLAAVMITAVKTSTRVGGISPGDLIMIQGMLLQLWAPLQFLGWFYRELRTSLVDIAEFFDILRTQSNIKDGPITSIPDMESSSTGSVATHQPHQLHQHTVGSSGVGGSKDGVSVEGTLVPSLGTHMSGLRVVFEDVEFGYLDDRQILNGISLSIEPGTSVALIGASGSGKSTMLKLLTRLYDTNSGSVLLNGLDVKQLSKEALREAVAVVPQDTVLFNDTILQNIRYGRPGASDDEVMKAATMARLHDAVLSMPEGYATKVGERGLKLSGGEKQRVAIARAFLRSPRLLICDEATSALDSTTEAQIMSSLTELAEGRTSVFVAHRLSTIKNCDVIFVLKGGRVAESGSHAALMGTEDGLYRSMWEIQLAEEAQGPHAAVGLNLISDVGSGHSSDSD